MEQEKTAGAREARREEWRRIIAEQQAGGQGAAAYFSSPRLTCQPLL